MKKILLAVSCAAAMAMSLNVHAGAKKKVVEKAAGQGAAATSTVSRMKEAVTSKFRLKSSNAGAAAGSMKAGQAGSQQVATGATCNLNDMGGVNTTDAASLGMINGIGACSDTLSRPAKGVFGRAIQKGAAVLKGFGVGLARNASVEHRAQSVVAVVRSMASQLGLTYANAKARFTKVCNQCDLAAQSLCAPAVLAAAK